MWTRLKRLWKLSELEVDQFGRITFPARKIPVQQGSVYRPQQLAKIIDMNPPKDEFLEEPKQL